MSEAPDDQCLASWCSDDDWCAVTCAMEVIGNKWHPVIVHRLLEHGSMRFSELVEELDGITNKTLSTSLEDLEEKGVVDRTVEQSKPVRVSYGLTDEGEALRPVIEELETWGRRYLDAPREEATC